MRRALAVAVAAVATVGLVAGCGNQSSALPATTAPSNCQEVPQSIRADIVYLMKPGYRLSAAYLQMVESTTHPGLFYVSAPVTGGGAFHGGKDDLGSWASTDTDGTGWTARADHVTSIVSYASPEEEHNVEQDGDAYVASRDCSRARIPG